MWGSGQAGWEKPRRERQKKTAVLFVEAEVCGWELWGWRWHSGANTDLGAVWYLNEPKHGRAPPTNCKCFLQGPWNFSMV